MTRPRPTPTTPLTTLENTVHTTRTRLLAGLGALVLGGTLAACSSGAEGASGDAPAAAEADALSITDPWVKAADEGMTAAFGTLTNDSDADVRVVSATSTATSSMELHEMATGDDGEMVMQQKAGGFVVAAGESHELSPGGDHLMFMDVTEPIQPGDEVTVTLTAEDGSTYAFTAPARTFSGANEEYHGEGAMEEGDTDMGGEHEESADS
ncbi:copper chaperone PCu(A)C [Cellulosimicrobium marinum]|uniref:copper chaperone PCu(A)C n=1 Tax=Cellulosimicrobium marinum TaxID=1638992 RepID=UPI001E4B59F2|nr:copper chaperone PCu(A)C [Cellulosimicrobium marinum]MCB7135605.1 copper chaperone PCu(A)C [Cellulosimicrobium marinum]